MSNKDDLLFRNRYVESIDGFYNPIDKDNNDVAEMSFVLTTPRGSQLKFFIYSLKDVGSRIVVKYYISEDENLDFSPRKQEVLETIFKKILLEIFKSDENIGLNIARVNRVFKKQFLGARRGNNYFRVFSYNDKEGEIDSCSTYTTSTLQDGMFERLLNLFPRKAIRRMPEEELHKILNDKELVEDKDIYYTEHYFVGNGEWDGIGEIESLKQLKEFNDADEFYEPSSTVRK